MWHRSLYGFRQFEPYDQCSPSGGAGVRVRGGGRPGGGDVRRGGPSAVEHTEGGGTTFVTGAATDVRSRASHASTLLDRRRVLDRPRIRIIALLSDHVIIPGLSVSAVVSWDTPKFVAPNRTHLSHSRPSGWVDRSDGPQRNSGGPPQGNEI